MGELLRERNLWGKKEWARNKEKEVLCVFGQYSLLCRNGRPVKKENILWKVIN